MTRGLLFLLATGLFWTGLAAVVASASRAKLSISVILPVSAVMVLAASGYFILRQESVAAPLGESLLQGALLVAAGAANYLMLKCVQAAMKRGCNGVVWAFTQSAMIMPFAMGIFVFGESASILRLGGLATILTALGIFSISKQEGSASGHSWLLPTMAAFLLSGAAQSFGGLPSYLRLEGMTALNRLALIQVGILIAAALDFLPRKHPFALNRLILLYSALFGSCNLLALLFFYSGLNDLAEAKCAAIGYPAAQGISIALFFLFNAVFRREPTPISAWIAFLVLSAGIALAALGSL